MSGHLRVEVISAYVDDELSPRRRTVVDGHLENCSSCRERLAGMRSAVGGVRRLEKVAPPPAIAFRVRQEIARRDARPAGFFARLRSSLSLTTNPALSTPLGMALALLLSVLVFEGRGSWFGPRSLATDTFLNIERANGVRPAPEFHVEAAFGDPLVLPETTSEVAGRVFVLTDNGWVQQGVDGRAPEARVRLDSAQGRRLLAQLTDLNVLLADGSRVVLLYQLRTLELSSR
jgi:anti-sigma factor RsiW